MRDTSKESRKLFEDEDFSISTIENSTCVTTSEIREKFSPRQSRSEKILLESSFNFLFTLTNAIGADLIGAVFSALQWKFSPCLNRNFTRLSVVFLRRKENSG